MTVKLPSCKKSVKVNFSVTVAEQQEEQRRQTHVHHVVSVAVVSEFSLQHSDPNAPPVSTTWCVCHVSVPGCPGSCSGSGRGRAAG